MTTIQKKLIVDRPTIDNVFTWGYRIVILFGLFAIMWLNQNYVTRKEFQDTSERLRKIEDVLIRMETCTETNARQDTAIERLDQRLRILEFNCGKR